jgi:glycogen debranching enzyme
VWGDPGWAAALEQQAAELKERFNRDFWIPERNFFALALDAKKRKVDSLTSNIGHLLWSGIANDDKAQSCVHHLMGEDLFSGWGVRTMATTEGSYNPIGYHVGTVWPHDNSIIAWGLRRYGYKAESAMICRAMLEAANLFRGRLPEAFGGYPRRDTHYPVEYPTACSPQAWATGAPLLFLRALLGLDSDERHLIVDPAIPEPLGQIELLDLPGCWGRMDAFGRARAVREVTPPSVPAS